MPPVPPSNIRNLIFDLGGVLLNINPLLSLQELSRLSGKEAAVLAIQLAESNLFGKLDTGRISPEEFHEQLSHLTGQRLEPAEADRIWNLLLLDFPEERIRLLEEAGRHYRIFLLSNTNIIHYRYYTESFRSRYGFPMEQLFETLYLSYEIGMHKPETGIYDYLLKKSGLTASECCFFDDSLPNLQAAEKIGIHCIHITPEHDIMSCFSGGKLKEGI
jgi:glucose-1-phosphatase